MKKQNLFWAVFFLIAAACVVLNQFGLFAGISVWSILITILLVAACIESLIHKNYTGVLLSIAVLVIIWAKPLGLTGISPWAIILAALLAGIGISMLLPHRYHHDHQEQIDTVDHIEGNDIEFDTSFGSSIKYVNSDDFRYAHINCSFGGMKVYLDNAVIQEGSATLDMHVSFGGVDLFVPKTWNVSNQIAASPGGVDEKNRPDQNNVTTLTLTGNINFAGVTITYI